MIHITCGHEKSIGLEVLFKSLKQFKEPTSLFCLYARKSDIDHCLEVLGYKSSYLSENILTTEYFKIQVKLLEQKSSRPVSTESLNMALSNINSTTDILLTLPTSKDQLILNNQKVAGYTYFLRQKYEIDNLCMYFSAPNDHVLLITDHIPLREVCSAITEDLIISKIQLSLKYHEKYFFSFDEVLIAGINPHAGENGLLGNEDQCIDEAIAKLKSLYKKINFIGPLSGDTLHFHHKKKSNQLKVYMYHDQGLPAFKAKNGVIGLNITLGLPFLRMSVDHGTAFELFDKKMADESGCLYMLEEAYKSQINLLSKQ